MQRFIVDLKTFLGLSVPKQYCSTVKSNYLTGLWVRFKDQKIPTLHDPNDVLYDYFITTFHIKLNFKFIGFFHFKKLYMKNRI